MSAQSDRSVKIIMNCKLSWHLQDCLIVICKSSSSSERGTVKRVISLFIFAIKVGLNEKE